ncbi:facilitated trehalose transporter Tret1-like [Cydia amplana]|uniref:facilitated trehalose transporter Tret1-like n=1 Tax=Cydia amplana TaxID=1869771 RepID=UPI002FE51885
MSLDSLQRNVITVNLGHIMTGYSIGWSSPELVKLLDAEQSPLPDVITTTEASWIASSFTAGLIIGSGSMCVLFYATMIFENAVSSVAPETASIVLGLTQFAGAIVTPFFIDKYGRRTLLMTSLPLCCLFLVSYR